MKTLKNKFYALGLVGIGVGACLKKLLHNRKKSRLKQLLEHPIKCPLLPKTSLCHSFTNLSNNIIFNKASLPFYCRI